MQLDSYCYCGRAILDELKDLGELNENTKVQLLPTIVKPLLFDPYTAEDFSQLESGDDLSANSLTEPKALNNHFELIPFLPILHAITYASKHAQLLNEPIRNYEYYE